MRVVIWLAFIISALIWGQSAASSAQEFPFTFRDGLIWLTVNSPRSPRPLNFLLDSGASVSVLNARTSGDLNMQRRHAVRVKGVGSNVVGYWPQQFSGKIGEISLPKRFLAVDLSELSRACSCSIDGLLGSDFFRGRVLQIDFDAQKIRLLESAKATANCEVLPLLITESAFRTTLQINRGRFFCLRLDTGCASSLEWVTGDLGTSSEREAACVGLSQTSIPQAKTTINLGNATMDEIPTGLHRQRIFVGEDGLLGNGILSRFSRITIDTKKNRLVLESRAM